MRAFFQGLFLAPQMVGEAVKVASLAPPIPQKLYNGVRPPPSPLTICLVPAPSPAREAF